MFRRLVKDFGTKVMVHIKIKILIIILRSKEVAKINHTFVVELKPEKSDIPESGFEMPEDEIEKTGLEMYDGFLEYMNSFLVSKVDPAIVDECKLLKTYMLDELKEIQEQTQF